MNILERKSIRIYKKDIKITDETLQQIILEANLAPSSMNMQPWRYVIIRSEEGKNQLLDALYGNKTQLQTSAAMIVIFNDLRKFDLAEKIYNEAVNKGYMPVEVREKQLLNIQKMTSKLDYEKLNQGGLIDCGLAAMNLMHVARLHGYDTCPIGGFNHEKIFDVCDMDSNRYTPVMIVSIGVADESGFDTVRLPFEEVAKFK